MTDDISKYGDDEISEEERERRFGYMESFAKKLRSTLVDNFVAEYRAGADLQELRESALQAVDLLMIGSILSMYSHPDDHFKGILFGLAMSQTVPGAHLNLPLDISEKLFEDAAAAAASDDADDDETEVPEGSTIN